MVASILVKPTIQQGMMKITQHLLFIVSNRFELLPFAYVQDISLLTILKEDPKQTLEKFEITKPDLLCEERSI